MDDQAPPRRRGAKPGNRNALLDGSFTTEAIEERRRLREHRRVERDARAAAKAAS